MSSAPLSSISTVHHERRHPRSWRPRRGGRGSGRRPATAARSRRRTRRASTSIDGGSSRGGLLVHVPRSPQPPGRLGDIDVHADPPRPRERWLRRRQAHRGSRRSSCRRPSGRWATPTPDLHARDLRDRFRHRRTRRERHESDPVRRPVGSSTRLHSSADPPVPARRVRAGPTGAVGCEAPRGPGHAPSAASASAVAFVDSVTSSQRAGADRPAAASARSSASSSNTCPPTSTLYRGATWRGSRSS